MKLYGIAGKGTGKVGSYVYAIRKGEQIVRQYNPNVINPNTRLQVGQRAKFKLLSQLSAIVADGIMFRSLRGGRSMRNEFMRANMGAVSLSPTDDVALLDVSNVVLTDGNTVAPSASFDRSTGVLSVDLTGAGMDDVLGIGYAVIATPSSGRVVGYSGHAEKEEGATAITVNLLVDPTQANKTNVLVWAYRFSDDAARARYENVEGTSTNDEVALNFERMLNSGLIVPTQTVVADPTQA